MTLGQRALGRPRTRAEQVRARRARQLRKVEPLANVSKPRRRQRPRRRYDLAIPVELGAEVQLPAMPTIHAGARLLSALLLAASIWGLYQLFTAPVFQTRAVKIEGARLLSPAQIQSIAGVDGRPVFLFDPAVATERLLAQPEVAAARVSVRWPGGVEVELIERTPMIEWNDAGRSWWLSAEGIAFLKRGAWPGMVRVSSESAVLNIGEDPAQAAIEADILLAASVLSAQVPEIAQLTFDPVRGLGFNDQRGWKASFGVGGDMVMKYRLYSAIAGGLDLRGIRPGLVSVENPLAPYYIEER